MTLERKWRELLSSLQVRKQLHWKYRKSLWIWWKGRIDMNMIDDNEESQYEHNWLKARRNNMSMIDWN